MNRVISLALLTLLLCSAPAWLGAQTPLTLDQLYKSGLQSLSTKQYDQALQSFNTVLGQNPNHNGALQGRGNCYYYQGQYQKSLEDFQKAESLQPSPALEKFIQFLQAKTVPPLPSLETQPVKSTAKVISKTPISRWGLRLLTRQCKLNMPDFEENAQTAAVLAAQAWQSDTSTRIDAYAPDRAAMIVIEPAYQLDSSFEVSLQFSIMQMLSGGITQTSNSVGPTNFAMTPSAFLIGPTARFNLDLAGFPLEFSAGPMMGLVGLNYSGSASSVTVSGNSSVMGLGLQARASWNWEFFNGGSIGPNVGYQLLSASGFHTTVSGSGLPSLSGQWMMVPGPQGTGLSLVSDGTTPPAGSRPFSIDLSGFNYGAHLMVFF